MDETKPFSISKDAVWQAYRKVKANAGAAGVDELSIADFEVNLRGNLYKIWNRTVGTSVHYHDRTDDDEGNDGTSEEQNPTLLWLDPSRQRLHPRSPHQEHTGTDQRGHRALHDADECQANHMKRNDRANEIESRKTAPDPRPGIRIEFLDI